MKLFLAFILPLMPLLGFAQGKNDTFKLTPLKDALFSATVKLDDRTSFDLTIKANNETELDSMKKGYLPQRYRDSLETIRKGWATIKENRKTDLKKLENTPIPDFEAKDTEGVPHRPMQYAGRVLILHFWNFWDQSFKNEIPTLHQLLAKYQPQGLQILSFVDIEIGKDEKARLEKSPISFPLVQNARQFMHQFIKTTHSTPYLILVDKQGKMRLIYVQQELNTMKSGFYNGELEAKINALLIEY